jgi:lysophospholipase L1-like esterase
VPPSQPDPNRPASGPTVRFLGRFDASDPNAGILFAWPASSIFTRFSGTGLAVSLAEAGNAVYQGNAVNNWYDVWVDGALGPAFKAVNGTTQYTVAQGLAQGDHYVRISKRTEPQIGTAIFRGFTPLEGGTLLPAPSPLARRIQFIGDSITAGYGADGNVAKTGYCNFTPATENADATYASMAAQALGAEFQAIAFSGKGIVQNNDCVGDANNTLPALYGSNIPLSYKDDVDFTGWVPQVVVINLGTNDYNMNNGCAAPNSAKFTAGWVNFVRTVRGHYPDAAIFCTVGPDLQGSVLKTAQTNIQAAVTALAQQGEDNVTYISLPANTGADGYGCASHPNRATHAQMASIVQAAIAAKMNW